MEETQCGMNVGYRPEGRELLGSRPRDLMETRDWQARPISWAARRDLRTAARWDRRSKGRGQAALERVAALYERFVLEGYDDGIKKCDLEALRGHVANMIRAMGPRQTDIDLMRVIRTFLRTKLGRSQELGRFFNLGELHMKIRHGREAPQNVAGRGNQIGRGRKEGRIDYCNLCNVAIKNYGAKRHHDIYHADIPYHRYISRRGGHVRRAATPSCVLIDCAAGSQDDIRMPEVGPCTRCGVPGAIIRRYRVRISRRGKVCTVSRVVARHKDAAGGKWKACILAQHKQAGQ